MQDATIVFTPQRTGLAAAARIVDGQFLLDATEGPTRGTYNVRVNPLEAEIEQADPNELAAAQRRPSIPKAYQRDGKLTAEISGQPGEPLLFELISSP